MRLDYTIRALLYSIICWQVRFEDTIGEPDGVRTLICCWGLSFGCYTCCIRGCYGLITFFSSVPLSVIWGCCFAFNSCCHVWVCTPACKLLAAYIMLCRRVYTSCIHLLCTPCCEACALCFSRINVNVTHKTGENMV